MTRFARVRAGMAIGRVLTATDLAALQADAQVQSGVTGCQAVLAARHRLGQLCDPDTIEMRA